MQNKCIVIGIDGLDADLLLQYKKHLPNFDKLIQTSPTVKMASVFPPDSPTAWASIYTGLNPAKHGVISFKDPHYRSKVGEYLEYVHNIAGRTFWDHAGRYNKKCCIVFPHLAYPPWPVNGIMVSRTTEVDIRKFDIKVYPANLSLKCNCNEVKPITSFPINPYEIIQPTKKLILNEVEFGLRLLRGYEWDLFFIFFSSLDNIEHIFWSEFQNQAKNKPYKYIVLDFYKFYDRHVIGKFLEMVNSNTFLIVLSDHGHGLRPYKVVNINEFLARSGLLKTKIKSNTLHDIHYLIELARKKLTGIISEKRVAAKIASKFLSLFPRGLGLYTTSTPIDWKRTVAYLSDCSAGLKAYCYAGVRIKNSFSLSSYNQIRHSIIDALKQIKDPTSSESIIEWVMKREDLYEGPYLSKYPDILFKLRDDWGVGWEINGSLYGKSISHRLFPGNHRQESAVLLVHHPYQRFSALRYPTLTDVAPTILWLLGVHDSCLYKAFDGQNILQYNH